MKSKVLLAIVIGLLTTYGISRLISDGETMNSTFDDIEKEKQENEYETDDPSGESSIQQDIINLIPYSTANEHTAFSIDYGDTLFLARKTSDGWITSNGRALDRDKVEAYLNGFRSLTNATVINDFDEMRAVNLPQQSLLLENIQLEVPIEIFVFHDTTRLDWPIIIRSNHLPNTYFGSDSSGIYYKIIKPIKYFLE